MNRSESQHYGRRRSNTAQSIMRPNPTIPVSPTLPLDFGDTKVLNLWVHDPKESPSVIFNHSWWPGVAEGDMLRVTAVGVEGASSCFLFVVSRDEGCPKPQLQISVPRAMAESCNLKNNGEVVIRKVDPSEHTAHYADLIFQDQYLGRNDMWRLGQNLVNQCVYTNQEISFMNAPLGKIQDIFVHGKKVSAARITSSTKMIYRSLSAKIMIFIQVCQELWEFATDGERFNEKIVHSFLPALFTEWKQAGTNHIVTIVLMSRVYYEQMETDYAAGPLQQDEDGRWYKDFFKVITDLEVLNEWKPTLVALKTSFVDFQRDILLAHHYHRGMVDVTTGATEARLVGRISCAHDGPILEGINLALNPTESHYIDRSLTITGSATIIVTPGTGYFRVSKRLLRLTTSRMLDQGFCANLISLSKPPLHVSPIFSFEGTEPELKPDYDGKLGSRLMDPLWGGDDDRDDHVYRERTTFWWEPFWLSISFWDHQMDLPFRRDRFVARAKMHEVQMLGLLEHDVLASIEVPFLPEDQSSVAPNMSSDDEEDNFSRADADAFDHNIFAPPADKRPQNASRNSFASSTSTVVPSSSYRSERRSMMASHRTSVISNIPPIQESPRRIIKHLPPDDISDTTPQITTSALSVSPSASSIRSTSTTLSAKLQAVRRDSSASRTSLASKLAPSWLFNPFKATASEPKTTTVSASASPNPPSTPTLTTGRLNKSMRVPKSGSSPGDIAFPTGSSTATPRAISIKKPTGAQAARTFEDETPTSGRMFRRSPMGTPHDDSSFPKRRGTANSQTSPYSSSYRARANPSRNQPTLGSSQLSLARRWQHLNPCPSYKHEIKWKPLVTPACLPLTIEAFPSPSELESSYDMFQYAFVVDPTEMRSFLVKPPVIKGSPEEIRRACALVVMRGMAAVRLAQGFQFVLKSDGDTDRDGRRNAFLRPKSLEEEELSSLPSGASQILRVVSNPVYLSMSNEIHRLVYTGDSIHVRRYVRRMPPMPPLKYKCLIWPKLGVGYTEHRTSFTSMTFENYGWNRLDMLVAGYEREFSDSLRYWRTRFVVIPTDDAPSTMTGPNGEELDEEEIRLVGIDKLAEHFSKIRWQSPEERAAGCTPLAIRFLPTTLGPVASVSDKTLISQLDEIHAVGPLKKKIKSEREISSMAPSMISKAMREEGLIRQNHWHGSPFPNSFTGFDLVSWMVREFRDISSRGQATELAVKLLEGGVFEHCRGQHGFLDGHYFYRLKGEQAVPMTPRGWFRSARNVNSDDAVRSDTPGKVTSPLRKRRRLLLSQSTVIDVDPGKRSDQAEAVLLHHDIIHNPATVFHFEFQWIGTTARCIEDMLRQINRSFERYGLRLVEAYVTQISDVRDQNPFQSCFPVKLALPPPVIPNIEKRVPEGIESCHRYFEYALLRKFNFILDMEAADMYPEKVDVVYSYRRSAFKYSQFVHRSGVAFVQVVGGKEGFLFLTNRLLGPGRLGTAKGKDQKLATAAEDLRVSLAQFCSSEAALREFYEHEEAQLQPAQEEEPTPLTL